MARSTDLRVGQLLLHALVDRHLVRYRAGLLEQPGVPDIAVKVDLFHVVAQGEFSPLQGVGKTW